MRMEAPAESASSRIQAFVQMGRALAVLAGGGPWPGHAIGLTRQEYGEFAEAMDRARVLNAWFTAVQVRFAAKGLATLLDTRAMQAWLEAYPELGTPREPKAVGIIMAGNVPFVGFHDLLCVLLCGHAAVVRTATDDAGLTAALVALLGRFAPELAARVTLAGGRLGAVDALIATGSNNTARYFTHYFGHLPHIIRRNRTSVAVLDGSETAEELAALGGDVFRYFGLGCRNVGMVFIPRSFHLDRLFGAFFPWKDIILHHKYANNYDYNRAVWMLDRAPITENGFLVMKEETALESPVAALYYARYDQLSAVEQRLAADAGRIQCIVGHGHLPFGTAQLPGPAEYADKVDTMAFLLALGQGTKV